MVVDLVFQSFFADLVEAILAHSATVTLAYVAAMQEHGVPVTFAYISDAHDNHNLSRASGPGEADYKAQLAAYDDAFAKFFDRLAAEADGAPAGSFPQHHCVRLRVLFARLSTTRR